MSETRNGVILIIWGMRLREPFLESIHNDVIYTDNAAAKKAFHPLFSA
jgi:hypothetical protein